MYLSRTLLSLALVGVASTSQAATVTVLFDNPIFGMSTPSYDGVSITYPPQLASGPQSASVAAGRFQGSVDSYSGVDASIFVDGPNNLFMYCYDVYERIGGDWTVNYTINPDGASARTLDFLGAVNHVLNQGQSPYDPFAWLHPRTGYEAAAIQLGIWESKYEDVNGAWNIAIGSFSASGLEGLTKTHLDSFFAAIGSASLNGKYVMTLEAPLAQDMITGDPPPTEVPEPGALALLAAALVGLVTTRRRAGRVAAAST